MKTAKDLEPMELAYVDVPEEFTGTVIDKLSQRKGELQNMGVPQRRLYPTGISDSCPRTHRIPWRVYDRHQRATVS